MAQPWSWTFDLGGRNPRMYVAVEDSPGGEVHLHGPGGVQINLGIKVRRAGTDFDPRAAADAVEESLAFIEKTIGVPKARDLLYRGLVEEDGLEPSRALAIADDTLEATRVALAQERSKIASVREELPPPNPSRWRVVWALIVTVPVGLIVVEMWMSALGSPSFVAVSYMIAVTGVYALPTTHLWRWTRGKRIPAFFRHRVIKS